MSNIYKLLSDAVKQKVLQQEITVSFTPHLLYDEDTGEPINQETSSRTFMAVVEILGTPKTTDPVDVGRRPRLQISAHFLAEYLMQDFTDIVSGTATILYRGVEYTVFDLKDYGDVITLAAEYRHESLTE